MRKLLVLSVLAAAVSFAFVSCAEWRRPHWATAPSNGSIANSSTAGRSPGRALPCSQADRRRPEWRQRRQVSIQLAVGGEEIEGKDWSELADKLKAPALKKEGSDMLHKLRVFNQLGLEGWEVVSHAGADGIGTSGTGSWMLKRRVP